MTQRDEILRHVIGRTTSRVRLETVVSMGHRRRLDIVTAEGAATLFFDQGLGSWDAVDDPAFDSNASIADPIVATEARSEERRVGKGCVSTCRSRWSPYH